MEKKITSHAKNQENSNLNETRYSTEDNTEIRQIWGLSHKNFKADKKILQESIIRAPETKGEETRTS